MSITEDSRSDSGFVRKRLAAALLITASVWIWVRLTSVVIGHSSGAGPLILEQYPVVRDVGFQLLRALLAVSVALVAVRVFDIPRPLEWMGVRRPNGWDWAYVPIGLILAFVCLFGSVVVIENVLGLQRTTGPALAESVRLSRVLTLLVLVGPAEELIFHGVVQRSLEDVTGLWPAIFLGGILFGITHVDPAVLALGDILFYGAQAGFGIIAGWIYARTDNLVIPALVHGLFTSITTALPLLLG